MPPEPNDETIEAIANAIERDLANTSSPFQTEYALVLKSINDLDGIANRIAERWKREYLSAADPNAGDPDEYAKPVIVFAEILRRHRHYLSFAELVYERCIAIVNRFASETNRDLHRGALYANLGIVYLDQGRYREALPWLHAAAMQDVNHRGAVDIYGSYAFSADGIFGQWLGNKVLPLLPADVLEFVNNRLTTTYSADDAKQFMGWLAGRGDLHIVNSLLDFAAVDGMNDFHANSVRLSCVRDLATLFEVVLKQIGKLHKVNAVAASFVEPPTLAKLICHMHFSSNLKKRRNDPTLNVNRREGIFHHPLLPNGSLLDAIDTGIDFCAGDANNVNDVLQYLQATTLSPNSDANETAKRFLLAYKLRNTTSHGFEPMDPNMSANFHQFRLWLLQAIFFLYFWNKKEGYASL